MNRPAILAHSAASPAGTSDALNATFDSVSHDRSRSHSTVERPPQ